MKDTRRTDKSLLSFLVQFFLKPFGAKIAAPKNEFPAGSPELTPHSSVSKHCRISSRRVQGIWIYDLSAKSSSSSKVSTGNGKTSKRRIYYVAGGTWQEPPSPQHWKLCTEMCRRMPDSTISVISMPLAPNSPAPKVFDDILALYHELMSADDESITFAGDSSGGNIILSVVLAALSGSSNGAKSRAPDSILLVSPAVDLRPMDAKNAELAAVQKRDPVLVIPTSNKGAAKWVGDWDAADPRVTPVNAELGLLAERGVKVYGVTGGNDIRTPEALRFRDLCVKHDVQGEWLDWGGQMHCFPLAWMYGIRESKEGKEWILRVLA